MPGAGACEHSWVLEALGTKKPSLWQTIGEAEEGSSDSSPSGKVCNMDADLLANQKKIIPNFLGSGAWWNNMFEERLQMFDPLPGDSKWPFYPLISWRSLNHRKGHLTFPKRSQRIAKWLIFCKSGPMDFAVFRWLGKHSRTKMAARNTWCAQAAVEKFRISAAGPNNTHWKHTDEDTFNLIKVSWGEETGLKMAILMLINLFLV